jgi:hypothetical protein|tara:strand:+ start:597 stop:1487 length:891 start_codon:yes stop_codon:yes gene_type:complete
MSYLVTAAITVGGSLLAGKIARNTANDPKAAIGTGTAPAMQTGPPIEVTPVQGTRVEDFVDFESENLAMSDEMTERDQLLLMLQQSGVGAEGLAGLAFGGPVKYKSNGGGIWDNFIPDWQVNLNLERLKSELVPGGITHADIADPTIGQDQHMMQKMSNFAVENPEMFNAGIGAITKVLGAVFDDPPEHRGSIVSTQTLPGNSNRRRSNLENITPIGGSKVTFANKGTALNRPMFMPHGGKMRGPGGPKDDLIPVMASNGEFMLSKAAVDAAGGGNHAQGIARLEAFNKLGNQRYG